MDILTVDFETYYDKEYSLNKLTTEAYVRDSRFETILVSVKVNDDEPIVYLGDDVAGFLAQFDWSRSAALAHHAAFDGAILAWHYGIRPKLWLDTVSMARPKYMLTCGVSLDALTQRLNLGQKGTAVLNALGKRKADFTRQELEDYGAYCKQDVNLTYKLFNHLAADTEKRELAVIDQTIRMFTEPSFVLDKDILREHLTDVQTKKANLLAQIDADKDALMSNDKFAEVLRGLGVEPPTKVSPKTGKVGYAFAKTDPGMKELQESDDPMVQAVVAARLGVKSTLEETRTQNFLAIAERGPLPIMLKYWGAHTGRFSGDDGMNLQNLPRGGRLRDALLASPSHVVIVSDSAQIEARIVAWLAGQDDLVEAFFNGRDVYAEFASEVYGRLITKETNPLERFIGKTCIAEGTLLLTDSGLKPIEAITLSDKLWDGEQWVEHEGLLHKGIKPVARSLPMTPDHDVWCGKAGWKQAQLLEHDASTLSQALDFAAESLPSLGTSWACEGDLASFLSLVAAEETNTRSTPVTSKHSSQRAATTAPRKRHRTSDIGHMLTRCRTTSTDGDYLTGLRQQSLVAIQRLAKFTLRMAVAAYQSTRNGAKTALRFLDTFRRAPAGTMHPYRWTESTTTETTSLETSDLFLSQRTQKTSDKSANYKHESLSLKNVYDVANAGPKHRFFILTERGFLCVSNCILGLGYGMGAKKLRATLASGATGPVVHISQQEAERIISVYRKKNHKIKKLWYDTHNMLTQMVSGGTAVPLAKGILGNVDTLSLPGGGSLRYPNLRGSEDGFLYDARKKPVKIYGGKCVENIVQHLAQVTIKEHMSIIRRKYRVVLQVHDEIVCMVPEAEAEEAKAFIRAVMSQPPSWGPDIPIACEIDFGPSYGDAK